MPLKIVADSRQRQKELAGSWRKWQPSVASGLFQRKRMQINFPWDYKNTDIISLIIKASTLIAS